MTYASEIDFNIYLGKFEFPPFHKEVYLFAELKFMDGQEPRTKCLQKPLERVENMSIQKSAHGW